MSDLTQEPEFLTHLIEQIGAIKVETEYNARIDVIKGKWEIGNLITAEDENFKKFEYGSRVIESIGNRTNISTATLWKCIQFKKQFPNWEEVESKLPEGKNVSWFYITQKVLPALPEDKQRLLTEGTQKPDKEKCEHPYWICGKCHKRKDEVLSN